LPFFGRFIAWWIFLNPLISAGKNRPYDSAEGLAAVASITCGIFLARRRVKLASQRNVSEKNSLFPTMLRAFLPFGLHVILFTLIWMLIGDDGGESAGRAFGIGFGLFAIITIGTGDIFFRVWKKRENSTRFARTRFSWLSKRARWQLIYFIALGIFIFCLKIVLTPRNHVEKENGGFVAPEADRLNYQRSSNSTVTGVTLVEVRTTPTDYQTARDKILDSKMGREPAMQKLLQGIEADRLRLQKANQEIIAAFNALDVEALTKNSDDSSRQINRLILAANSLAIVANDYEQRVKRASLSSGIVFNAEQSERITSGCKLMQTLAEQGHAVADAATLFSKVASDENANNLDNRAAAFVNISETMVNRGKNNMEKLDQLIGNPRGN
jgi:hypothetical protein